MNYGPLVIGTEYPDELLTKNRAVIIFIISKSDDKVIKTTVVEREALNDWFTTTKTYFKQEMYRYIIASVSIVGEIITLMEPPDRREPSHSETPKSQLN